MAKKKANVAAKPEGRLGGVKRYFREVRGEINKVVWPTRRAATNLTLIVLAVTVVMSAALGLIDWVFSQLFSLIIG